MIGVVWFCSMSGVLSYDINTDFPYDKPTQTWIDTTDIGQIIKEEAIDPTDSASEQIQEAFNINLDAEDDQRATAYLKEVINWTLAIVWLVALTTVIYGFYRMVLSSDDQEWIKNARKIIITAFVALMVIGLARVIVSQFFDIFFQVKAEVDA